MVAKSNDFASAPDLTKLGALRTSWKEAYVSWQTVELFNFGPGDRNTIRNFYNIYPADEAGIALNIADPTISLSLPASYARQGFPALDYLINGVADTDQGIVDYFTLGSDAANRTAYLKKLTDRMDLLLEKVLNEWKTTYRDTFVNSTGLDAASSTSQLVNAFVLNYERYIRSGKFGIPSGAMTTTGGSTYPEKVEAVYKKDLSLILAKTAHQASIDFFNGKNVLTGEEGPSLESYLDALDARDTASGQLLSVIINTQFAAANSKLNLLSDNLYQEVLTNNQAMIDVYTEMQRAVRMLKVDMTSAMSITITYTDNDGD
jgi:predicted lipoprotein